MIIHIMMLVAVLGIAKLMWWLSGGRGDEGDGDDDGNHNDDVGLHATFALSL